jgi:hypothetical protein
MKKESDIDGQKISKPEFLTNLCLKIQYSGLCHDIHPLLSLKSDPYNPDDAYRHVVRKVIKLLRQNRAFLLTAGVFIK